MFLLPKYSSYWYTCPSRCHQEMFICLPANSSYLYTPTSLSLRDNCMLFVKYILKYKQSNVAVTERQTIALGRMITKYKQDNIAVMENSINGHVNVVVLGKFEIVSVYKTFLHKLFSINDYLNQTFTVLTPWRSPCLHHGVHRAYIMAFTVLTENKYDS